MAETLPTLRIDWDGSTGLAQTGADVSARLLALGWERGREGASQLVAKSNAGKLIAILNNNLADYSPDNTSSPLTGNLEPDTSQKVRLTLDGRAAFFVTANSEFLLGGDVLDIVTDDFSIAFWIKPTALAQVGLVNKRDRASATNLGYAIELQSDGTLDAFLSDGTSVTTVSSTTTLTAGTWNLCIFTADRSGNGQWYINNGAAEGATDITSQNGTLANAINFQAGAGLSTFTDRLYGGGMVSLHISTKLYSTAERTFLWRDGDGVQHKDIGLTGDGSALKTSLLAWFDLQEESGTRVDSENAIELTDVNTVTATTGIPNFTMWSGFLKSIEPLPSTSGLNTARLTATGPLGAVNLNKIRLAMATNEATGTAIGRILTEANWPTNDRTVDAGQTTMTRFWLENKVRVIGALRRVESTETGFIGESKDGRIFFEDRRHRQNSPHTTSQATFTDANGGALVYSPPLRRLNSSQQLFHIFEVGIQTWTVVADSGTAVWTLSASGANSPAILPGETLTFWANYPNPSSATNAFAVSAWTALAATTHYMGGSTAGVGIEDLNASLSIVATPFGNALQMDVTNNHASSTVFLNLLAPDAATITKDDPANISVEKSATNPRTFPNPPEHLPDVAEGFDWCNWHSNIFGVSQPLLEMTVIGNRSEAQMKKVLGLDISDRFTFVGTNDTGLGINEDFFIEAQRYSMDPRTKLIRTTWAIAAASAQEAWTLGSSALGSATRLAY